MNNVPPVFTNTSAVIRRSLVFLAVLLYLSSAHAFPALDESDLSQGPEYSEYNDDGMIFDDGYAESDGYLSAPSKKAWNSNFSDLTNKDSSKNSSFEPGSSGSQLLGQRRKRAWGQFPRLLRGTWGKRSHQSGIENTSHVKQEKRDWKEISRGVWGKRSVPQMHEIGTQDKRNWEKSRGMWGKRGWNTSRGMWGKRAETYLESDNSDSSEKVKKEWNKSRGMWGKRSASEPSELVKRDWNKHRGTWGKRSSAESLIETLEKVKRDWNKSRGMWGKRVQSLEELSNQKVKKDLEDSSRILVKRDNEFILADNAEHKVETEKTPKNKDNFGVKRGLTYHWYKPFLGYKIRKFIPAGSPKEKRSRTWLQLRGMWGKRSGNQLQDDQEQKRRHEHITYSQIQNFGNVRRIPFLER